MSTHDLATAEGRALRQLDFARLAKNSEEARMEVVVWARIVVDTNAQGPDPKTGRQPDYVWRKLAEANAAYKAAADALAEFQRAYRPKEESNADR